MPPEPPDSDRPNPWGAGESGAAGPTSPRTVVTAEGDKAAAAEQFNCPNCGGSIEIKAAGYTVTVACQYCGSTLDVTDPDVRIIQRYEEEVRKLDLPLGSRGKLRGIEWEVIGYMRRSENGTYPWDEYLLFNPYYGYRFLDTDGRGWTLGRQLTEMPAKNGLLGFTVDGEFYEPFYAQTRNQVDFVLGEFYWQVQVGEEALTADYVRPGKMLSWESSKHETEWTLGELLEPNEVPDAFGVEPLTGGGLPLPHQPSPYKKQSGQMMKIAGLAAAAIILFAIMFGGTSDPETTRVNLATNGVEQSAKIGPIELTRPRQAVTVSARAPGIDNAWIDLAYTLTDRDTGDVYEASNVVEHYSGYDAEGNWTEGSRSSSSKFSMVPAGTYDLTVDAAGSQWLEGQYAATRNAVVEVSIARGATFYSNIILALIVVFVPAIWVWIRHLSFESRRKSDSDFAGDDDDDD
ncbi:DUF4178 domain-containing protein [uncultured Parasphingopyxis sp.]|uniref:DUF4178 domain-containing protein n=1 Tax=uncultured Parasphingopyxis sp. TaxID=1547918 RepID=UPI00263151B3|nr:DUF4178 domain-containing protein [uncultured Parasphingopyxis sp.]